MTDSNENPIKSVKDLRVYIDSYKLSMEVFSLSIKFPKEEQYSLTDQIRRSSRSVPVNIREGYAKKKYEQVFIRHLVDALGSSEETRGWLEMSKDLNYISENEFNKLDDAYQKLGGMINNLIKVWRSTK
jgi:four helix bundle protein